MGRNPADRELVFGIACFAPDRGSALAHPSFTHPQPRPCPLGAPYQCLLAGLGLSRALEPVPPAGTRKPVHLKRARRRKRNHVDSAFPGPVYFIFRTKDTL